MTSANGVLRILYYGGAWPTNIGNAFIDLGAMALLRAAFPHAQLSFASEMPPWLFRYAVDDSPAGSPPGFARRLFRRLKRRDSEVPRGFQHNALDICAVSACDLVVFSGMAMCREFVDAQGPSLLKLAQQGVKILLLGTGALCYDSEEKTIYAEFLKRVRPIGFVSRDDCSFEMFASLVENSFRGIDCGFFVPEAFTPFKLNLPDYFVVNFDSTPEPELDTQGLLVTRAHHTFFGRVPRWHTQEPRTLVSDIPQDYLTLYANCAGVYSDRVHACVATLAYGKRARLFGTTPRASLFDVVGAGRITKELVGVSPQLLAEKKEYQVSVVRRIVEDSMPAAAKGAVCTASNVR